MAALQIRSLQRLLPILLLPLLAFGLLMVARENQWEPFLYVFLIAVGLCVLGVWWLGRALERVEEVQPMDPERLKLARLSDPEAEEEARSQAMLRVGRPRPVRLIPSGRFYFSMLAAIVVVIELMILHHLLQAAAGFSVWDWIAVVGGMALLGFLIAVPLRLRRQKRLVEKGEVALGRVTKQWRVRGNSWIQYEVTLGGATLKKESIDASHRLYAGMRVPVFYDETDLSRQVPCCAAYYEVVLPEKGEL